MGILQDNMVIQAQKLVASGFTPYARPACAIFVSEVMMRSGWKGKTSSWVPDFVDFGKKVTTPNPGDIVIFKQTYDAVAPAGIGPEDDKTHIGILINGRQFAHYSASADKPVIADLDSYWNSKIEMFIQLSSEASTKPVETTPVTDIAKTVAKVYKMFYNGKVGRPNTVINKKEIPLGDGIMTFRDKENNEVVMYSHPFETNPYIRINKDDFKIESIEMIIKYKE